MTKNKLDRTKAPKTTIPETIDIPKTKKFNLSNGKEIYFFQQGYPELLYLEVIFDAGVVKANNPALANMTSSMLDEGNAKYNSKEISELIDYYGADLSLKTDNHLSYVKLKILKKHFHKLLEVFNEILSSPTFPDKEFELIQQNNYQDLLIQREETSFIATEKFSQVIFGENNIYGRNLLPKHFLELSSEQLKNFHKKNYIDGKNTILLAGSYDDKILNLLDQNLSIFNKKEIPSYKNLNIDTQPDVQKKHFIHKNNAMQASLRIGKTTIKKTHPDYIPLNIASVLLGGYFSSRLMKNIREDKGYTYNIDANVFSLFGKGIFFINAETKQETVSKTLEEINKELKIFRTTPVSKTELQTVKHYILGNLFREFDTPKDTINYFKSVHFYGLDENYFLKYIDTLKKITPTKIMEIAQKYLHEDSMYTIVCGDKNKMK